MHSLILYGSYLAFPFLALLIYLNIKFWGTWLKKKLYLTGLIIFYLLSLLFIYARFIERQLITVQTTQIEVGFDGRIAVISDIHLGAYKDEAFLARVVKKINEQEGLQALLIPGDFTYYPHQDLDELFAPLADLNIPSYAVLGNHDSEQPGPPLQEELELALEKAGVIFLHNESAAIPGTQIKILGLGDNWANEDDIELINDFETSDQLIVLTHNPDTTLNYRNSIPDITLAGHTHGGQIRIPWLYKKTIPCIGDFNQGLHSTPTGPVFVTSGVGEVGLPMRLGIPPVIEILEFK